MRNKIMTSLLNYRFFFYPRTFRLDNTDLF